MKNTFRRDTIEVKVGDVTIGGDRAIVVQSMVSSATTNIEGCVEESIKIIEAGGEMVRFTAASVAEAEAVGEIKRILTDKGYKTPLIADVHFNPKAAFAAAVVCDKVRINPGNFIDPRAKFETVEYSDKSYNEELKRLEEQFCKFLSICKQNNRAIRIGVNHGSLSDRIMSRYGDTINGMCESALEFLRISMREKFNNVVVSIKSSNVAVMVEAYRELAKRMDSEGIKYPLHLGVTEAGEGEDARVKSALGIGTLLSEGLGDTIRVSLTEPSWHEIDVAEKIVDYAIKQSYEKCVEIKNILRKEPPKVIYPREIDSKEINSDMRDISGVEIFSFDNFLENIETFKENSQLNIIFNPKELNFGVEVSKFYKEKERLEISNRVILKRIYNENYILQLTLKAAIDFGRILLSGRGDYIHIENCSDTIEDKQILSIIFSLLQASRARISRTEFISCPSCGRTQFAIAKAVQAVKERCSKFKGMKIAIMGCNVNGPGEMADANYGYIGAGKGKINLYKGRELVEKNIDEREALDKLVEMIEKFELK